MTNGSDPINPTYDFRPSPNSEYAIPFCDGGGLTKREYFAATAMQAFLSNTSVHWNGETIAKESVIYADLLILALNQ